VKSELPNTGWIKAARSSDQGDCVEMRRHSGSIEIRDSKNPGEPALRITARQFAAWLDVAKRDAFDHFA